MVESLDPDLIFGGVAFFLVVVILAITWVVVKVLGAADERKEKG